MAKVLVVFGTRPEAIKMAPLIIKLKASSSFDVKVCVTAQHRQLIDMVLDLFNIKPDYDPDLMSAGQSLTEITNRVIKGFQEILSVEKPDLVLVHGDTTTTFASALAAFYEKIPVGHVEAGLRSGNIYSPYPEEMNRSLNSQIAEIHFAPTTGNKQNLLDCGISENNIYVTGNTVIDALKIVIKKDFVFPDSHQYLNKIDYHGKRIILLIAHRRENWGAIMEEIFLAIKDILETDKDCRLIFPVHLNPLVKDFPHRIFSGHERITLIPPLDYVSFANLMAKSYIVLTDSGGIQEEAPSLGKPVLVLRADTERLEAVEAGTVKVVGVKKEQIILETQKLLNNRLEYSKMAKSINPYGDGRAAERIICGLKKWFESSI